MTIMSLERHTLQKYESTAHIEGSRLQVGDDASKQVPYSKIAGRNIVAEEKLDGGQSGVSFSVYAELLLQSKGHYLDGGGRERQFNLLKRWAAAHEDRLIEALDDRYLMFGEWCHKKHAIYYDRLPHFFNEFDVWDRRNQCYLATDPRADILKDLPVLPVPVLYRGKAPRTMNDLLARICTGSADADYASIRKRYREPESMLPHSLAKSRQWRDSFENMVKREKHDLEKCWKQADKSDRIEGLYIKVEEDGVVKERYKWVRSDFVQAVNDSGQHHSVQPFIPNQLAPNVDLYADRLTVAWADLGLKTVVAP